MNTEFDTRKPDFEKAQNAATDLLLQQNISGLYVDVRKFSFDRPIKIDSLQNYARITERPVTDFTCDKISGCCLVKHPRCSIILYDENEMNEYRKLRRMDPLLSLILRRKRQQSTNWNYFPDILTKCLMSKGNALLKTF